MTLFKLSWRHPVIVKGKGLQGGNYTGLSVVVAINRPGYNALMPHGKG
ncbi:putative membrane protein [Yersinia pestis PY-08]|uniref:Membrane protein n=1 Tax=Yersinia pestis PY-08 TaxID=992134 RepID=A0AB72ZPW2_YERPE|nr:hypothetical protein YpMG051020_2497 [Yersinia pestis biovar Orientalis str. MG05-1020]EIR24824.1 putative membrane protein [Yersinia pestis PY-08]EIR56330.1 hypothetical protein YPPY14_0242 [Yersinia pestis PY-14]EIS37669.1 putative membrane protein [Yersinia pestis PY-56]EIT36182.1 putative membrane protein [Yersinia pestis PY-96]